MTIKSILAALVAASFFTFAAQMPSYAQEEEQSIPDMEQEQMDDSAQPDVDADASGGTDEPIPEEEQEQIEN